MDPSRRSWIQVALWAFPLGLVVLGAVWTVFLLNKPEAAEQRDRRQLLGTTAINEGDLRRYVEALAEEIGPRSPDRPDSLRVASNYIESTLGPLNTGYPVTRLEMESGEGIATILEVEREGRERPNDVLVVGARYDSPPASPGAHDNASGVALLMGLARAFVEAEPPMTLRFCAFGPPLGDSGETIGEAYVRRCRGKGERITGFLELAAIGAFAARADTENEAPPRGELAALFPDSSRFLVFLGRTPDAALLNRSAALFSRFESFPSHRVILPEGAELPPSLHDAFRESDFPSVLVTDPSRYVGGNPAAAGDVPDRLDFESLARIAIGLEQVVRSLVFGAEEARGPGK